MALQPAFAVSATNPASYGYDPAQPGHPYANAYLASYGGHSAHFSPRRMSEQVANDEIIIGYDPVDPADENDLTSISGDIGRHSAIGLSIVGINVTSDNQYLVVYGLEPRQGSPIAQFFVGAAWVRSEAVDGDETIALLMDAPASGNVTVYLRLASEDWWSALAVTGIEGFIL